MNYSGFAEAPCSCKDSISDVGSDIDDLVSLPKVSPKKILYSLYPILP